MGEGTADVIPVLVVHTKRCGEMIGDGAVFILKKSKIDPKKPHFHWLKNTAILLVGSIPVNAASPLVVIKPYSFFSHLIIYQ